MSSKVNILTNVIVLGSKHNGVIIQGRLEVGGLVVLKHEGKVKQAIVVRTRAYTPFKVSFDRPTVVLKENTVKKNILVSKGLKEENRSSGCVQI